MLSQKRHVDVGGERHQSLVGADVRGRLLAPDVLLAGRERQTKGAAPLGVLRLPDEATRDLTLLRRPTRQETEDGTAIVHRDPERLRLAARDVDALFPRRR